MDQKALSELKTWLRSEARVLGFAHLGVTDTQLADDERHLLHWLAREYHGTMEYMARHHSLRARPAELVPETLRVISVTLNYFPPDSAAPWKVLGDSTRAYIARYALGRDYHKLMRRRLQTLATRLQTQVAASSYRVFVDSGPVLERALARNAGNGWIGKHTNLIRRDDGSYFFLGEILTDLPLPSDPPNETEYCGSCTACIEICPTKAIVAPYQLDARRCISYLTIEHRGSIPVELRPLIGNRIFGCDDCQLVCPWNHHATTSMEQDFLPRDNRDAADLCELFSWNEATFSRATEGSPLRRTGYRGWLRNLAVAMGNALRGTREDLPSTPEIGPRNVSRHAEFHPPVPINAADFTRIKDGLVRRREDPDPIVREHVEWALVQQGPSYLAK